MHLNLTTFMLVVAIPSVATEIVSGIASFLLTIASGRARDL